MTKCYILAIIVAVSLEYGVPPEFSKAIALTENWTLNPRAISPPNSNGSRDFGIFQINDQYFCLVEWYNPHVNIRHGVRHIRWLMEHPWTCTFWSVAVAYNAGLGRLSSPPASTIRYAEQVIRRFNELSGGKAPVMIRRF